VKDNTSLITAKYIDDLYNYILNINQNLEHSIVL